MSDFEKLINASDLIDWIMETYPDWCVGAVRGIVDHINKSPSARPEVDCQKCIFCGFAGFKQFQTAQTERQKGEWIDVGHKRGLFSHPESVNYKCSCCGYEQYTLFGFGLPRTCPECGADMRGEDDK